MNRGPQLSAERGRRIRAQHRKLIKSLPNYYSGFTREDIPLEVSVARRELRDMEVEGVIAGARGHNKMIVYRGVMNIVKIPWTKEKLGELFARI